MVVRSLKPGLWYYTTQKCVWRLFKRVWLGLWCIGNVHMCACVWLNVCVSRRVFAVFFAASFSGADVVLPGRAVASPDGWWVFLLCDDWLKRCQLYVSRMGWLLSDLWPNLTYDSPSNPLLNNLYSSAPFARQVSLSSSGATLCVFYPVCISQTILTALHVQLRV